jgi:diacylglycerol kinase family enzyme
MLDLLVLRGSSVGETMGAVWDLFTERTGTFGEDVRVGYARGREFSVRVADGTRHPVQMDGEPGGETPFAVSVVPGAVQILMAGE